jgi:hypothetical protein
VTAAVPAAVARESAEVLAPAAEEYKQKVIYFIVEKKSYWLGFLKIFKIQPKLAF